MAIFNSYRYQLSEGKTNDMRVCVQQTSADRSIQVSMICLAQGWTSSLRTYQSTAGASGRQETKELWCDLGGKVTMIDDGMKNFTLFR